jgi:hypothetical protein
MALTLVFIVLGVGCSVPQPSTGARNQLFIPSPRSYGTIDEAMRSRILRHRFVDIDLSVLKTTQSALKNHDKRTSILILNLFENALFPVALDRTDIRSSESFTCFGHVDGVENSQVTLVVENGVMVGDIRVREAYYQVRYAGAGNHVVYQVNPNAFPKESDPLIVPDGRNR